MNPAIGLFLGWLLLSESVDQGDFLGILPIVLGIFCVVGTVSLRRAPK
jgi:drug/metabolite transporter (DMT)-like permease